MRPFDRLFRRRLIPRLTASMLLFGGFCCAQQPDREPPSLPEAAKAGLPAPKSFLARWADFYRGDWSPATASSTTPARRGLPSPLDSPPFPNSDWSYGGSPVIGEPDGNVYPLMTAVNGARSRTKVYGWGEPTGHLSTSRNRNTPEVDDIYSNRVELGQVVVYVERLPDSVQRDHVDFGFHMSALYGTDY